MQLAAEAAPREAEQNSLAGDPWLPTISQLKGEPGPDGYEYVTTQQILDALGVPLHMRSHSVFCRLAVLMEAQNWQPCRIQNATTPRCRGYRRPLP